MRVVVFSDMPYWNRFLTEANEAFHHDLTFTDPALIVLGHEDVRRSLVHVSGSGWGSECPLPKLESFGRGALILSKEAVRIG